MRGKGAKYLLVSGIVCGAVVVGLGASSAAASDQTGSSPSPMVGGFGVGDGSEELVDPRTGAFALEVPVGTVTLTWSSQRAGLDRFGLGTGWGIAGVGFVDAVGGLRVFAASGGVYTADASSASGLRDYKSQDLRFQRQVGSLPERVDGQAGSRAFAYRLEELGGTTSYFSADGNPVARMDAHGNRTDWLWGSGNRLTGVVDPAGTTTAFQWSVPGKILISKRIHGQVGGTVLTGTINLRGGTVAEMVGAAGERTSIDYDSVGLIVRVNGASGATKEIAWQRLVDGSTVVSSLRIRDDATGQVLSSRSWSPVSGLESGYPTYPHAAALFASGDDTYRYTTALSDGHTTSISEYNSQGLLVARSIKATTPHGDAILQQHAYQYPGTEDGGVPDPANLPHQHNRPLTTTVSHRNTDSGKERIVTEEFVFDQYGRAIRHAAHGEVTATVYDEQIPPGRKLPIGLPLLETVTEPDGLITQTRYELNAARTAPTVIEVYTGNEKATAAGEPVLTRTNRVEHDIAADGYVAAIRQFEQGGTGTPVTTLRNRIVDLSAGTQTVSETIAAGTDVAATTTEVTDLVHGQQIRYTDEAGNTITTAYDTPTQRITQVAANGQQTTTTYQTMQQHGRNATITTTPNGVRTTEEHDALGRVIRITDNLRLDDTTGGVFPADDHVRVVETRSYPSPGIVEVTDAWGATSTTKHDIFGRQTAATTQGLTKVTQYDDVANTITTGVTPTDDLTDAETITTENRDIDGNVTAVQGSRADDGTILPTQTTFDGWGRPIWTSNGVAVTTMDYDTLGNPVSTRTTTIPPTPNSKGQHLLTESRTFDTRGTSVEKIISADQYHRSGGTRQLDLRDRVIAETDQNGTTTRYQYTIDSLPTKITTDYGQTTTRTYDPVTRELLQTRTDSPIGEPVHTAFEYHPTTGALAAVWDPADRAGTEIRYVYDGLGNLLTTRYPDGRSIRSTFDLHGRKTSTTDVDGNTTRLEYTPQGLLASATQTRSSGVHVASVTYEYDDFGRVVTLTRGNGVRTQFSYTSLSQIATETSESSNGQRISHRSYTYYPSGNLAQRSDHVHTSDTSDTDVTTTHYEYDALDRLISSTVYQGASTDGTTLQRTTYRVTVSGDVSHEQLTIHPDTPQSQTTLRTFHYTDLGQLVSIDTIHPDGRTVTAHQTYDAAGNLVESATGTRYAYNADNLPVQEVTAAGTVEIGYWHTGQRSTLTVATQDGRERDTRFYWEDDTLTNEIHTDDASTIVSYLLGATRHARNAGSQGGTVYYDTDRHGNVTELTDDTGVVVARYTYSDYGVTTTHTPGPTPLPQEDGNRVGDPSYQPFQYAGAFTNPTAGQLQWLQERAYDARTARFLSKDREELHNRYSYSDLNPVMNIDPTGRSSVQDSLASWVTMFVAVVSLALSAAVLPVAAGALSMSLTLIGAAGNMGAIGVAGARIAGADDEEALGWAHMIVGVAQMFTAAGISSHFIKRSAARAAEAAQKAAAPAAAATAPPAAVVPKNAAHWVQLNVIDPLAKPAVLRSLSVVGVVGIPLMFAPNEDLNKFGGVLAFGAGAAMGIGGITLPFNPTRLGFLAFALQTTSSTASAVSAVVSTLGFVNVFVPFIDVAGNSTSQGIMFAVAAIGPMASGPGRTFRKMASARIAQMQADDLRKDAAKLRTEAADLRKEVKDLRTQVAALTVHRPRSNSASF